ncbi:MAG: site-2 protease family protein [Phenylobacterium sp.]|uniref:site-2 protease family protein n=1 Tax=Phenylobacterium sp. TaxID=1871053 RepID=UPI00391B2E22
MESVDTGVLFRLKLFGIPVGVHVSWLLVAGLVAWSLAAGSLPLLYEGLPRSSYWLMALVAVVGLSISVVAHEMAHALTGRALGIRVERITLFLFGGVAELKDEPKSPGAEAAMAVAGPLASLAIAWAVGSMAGWLDLAGGRPILAGALGFLATLNLVLAVFNSIPAFPMDGGRVLRAGLWKAMGDRDRATRMAAGAGEAFGAAMIVLGAVATLTGHLGGLWWILIGMFIRSAARSTTAEQQARRVLAGLTVARLMSRPVDVAQADMTLAEFVAGELYDTRHGVYPVVQGARLVGVLEPRRILKTPNAEWARTRVADICAPLDPADCIDPGESAAEALQQVLRRGRPYLLATTPEGVLVGVVSLKDLLARVHFQILFAPKDQAAGSEVMNGEAAARRG